MTLQTPAPRESPAGAGGDTSFSSHSSSFSLKDATHGGEKQDEAVPARSSNTDTTQGHAHPYEYMLDRLQL